MSARWMGKRRDISYAVFIIFLPVALCYISTEPTSPLDISCHEEHSKILPVMTKDFLPPKNIIYFIETSCRGELKSRYACAVESAAKANPNWHVVVLFAGPINTEFRRSKLFRKLNSMPNLFLYRVYPKSLAAGTPLEKIFFGDALESSKYPAVHVSDLLRTLILYLFGGLYLDLDMIVLKSFDPLPNNFIAFQGFYYVAAGILKVSNDEIGRNFINMSIRDVAENYDSTSWADNANTLYERTLHKICQTNYTYEMNVQKCKGFHVLESSLFYPLFTEYYKEHKVPLPINDKFYTHHFWNSWGHQLKVTPNSFFSEIAVRYCPQVYNLYKDKFGE